MAAETMPETARLIDENGILKFPADQHGTEYIRADLCVLASTHQRVIEALREAEKALTSVTASAEMPMNVWLQVRAALATIKEHTP